MLEKLHTSDIPFHHSPLWSGSTRALEVKARAGPCPQTISVRHVTRQNHCTAERPSMFVWAFGLVISIHRCESRTVLCTRVAVPTTANGASSPQSSLTPGLSANSAFLLHEPLRNLQRSTRPSSIYQKTLPDTHLGLHKPYVAWAPTLSRWR